MNDNLLDTLQNLRRLFIGHEHGACAFVQMLDRYQPCDHSLALKSVAPGIIAAMIKQIAGFVSHEPTPDATAVARVVLLYRSVRFPRGLSPTHLAALRGYAAERVRLLEGVRAAEIRTGRKPYEGLFGELQRWQELRVVLDRAKAA